jgi:hypothetical protein
MIRELTMLVAVPTTALPQQKRRNGLGKKIERELCCLEFTILVHARREERAIAGWSLALVASRDW